MTYTLPIHSGAETRDRFNNLSEVERKQIIAEFLAIAEAPGVFGANQAHPADTATTVRVKGGRTLMMDGPSIEPGPNRDDDPIYAREDDHLVLTRVLAATSGLIAPLTARELEVLGLIAMGKSNRNIADELVVTLETVKKHASHIFAKLGAANRTEAVRNAQNLGLLSPSVATLGPSGCPLRGCRFVEQTAISFKEDGHEVHAADPLRR